MEAGPGSGQDSINGSGQGATSTSSNLEVILSQLHRVWAVCLPAILRSTKLYTLQAQSMYAEGTEDMSVASSSAPSDSQTAVDLAGRETGEHGCVHYRRRCRLVAPCCGELFWCRHCHNEAKSQDEMVHLLLCAQVICFCTSLAMSACTC